MNEKKDTLSSQALLKARCGEPNKQPLLTYYPLAQRSEILSVLRGRFLRNKYEMNFQNILKL